MQQADDGVASLMGRVARDLLGRPNQALSSKHEWRFGTHGSLSVDLRKGTYHDHEANVGGGVLDLIVRELGGSRSDAAEWLRDRGLDIPERGDGHRSHTGGHTRQAAPEGKDDAVTEERQPAPSIDLGRPTKTYDYIDETGTLLFQVCRYEVDGSKTFRQRRPGDAPGTWTWGVKDVRQIPYRLDSMLEAVARDAVVFIVEGEKDVDNLAAIGVPATCNAMGAGKWPEELNEHFRGANVIILPDNDDPGRKHKDVVGRALTGIASSIQVLDLPDLPEKGDVSDWLAAGGDAEKLYALVDDRARKWRPEDNYKSRFAAVRWADLDRPGPEHEWLIKGLLTRGERSMVAGPSQSGKSFAVLDIALSVARGVDYRAYAKVGGGPWAERAFKTRHGGVIYQAGEGGRGIKKRLRAYRIHNNIPANEELPFVLLPAPLDLHGSDEPTKLIIDEINHWSATFDVPLELVVIDTLSAATPGANENASEDMSRVLARCERIAQATNAHVMIVHHMNAAGEKPRGHSSIFANLDNAMVVRKVDGLREPNRRRTRPDGSEHEVPGREIREMALTKQKDGEDGTVIRFVLRSVEIGTDEDGDRITSCVAAPPETAAGSDAEAAEKIRALQLPDGAAVFYAAVRHAVAEHGIEPPPSLNLPPSVRVVQMRFVKARFRETTFEVIEEEDEAKRKEQFLKLFAKHATSLMQRNLIAHSDPYVWLIEKNVRGFRPSILAAPDKDEAAT